MLQQFFHCFVYRLVNQANTDLLIRWQYIVIVKKPERSLLLNSFKCFFQRCIFQFKCNAFLRQAVIAKGLYGKQAYKQYSHFHYQQAFDY